MTAEPHLYSPTMRLTCGRCGGAPDDGCHVEGARNEIGADATMCPGCNESLPVELTVRMLRFVRKDGTELRNVRVCKVCAGLVSQWVDLAVRREHGLLSDEEYYERLARLA